MEKKGEMKRGEKGEKRGERSESEVKEKGVEGKTRKSR